MTKDEKMEEGWYWAKHTTPHFGAGSDEPVFLRKIEDFWIVQRVGQAEKYMEREFVIGPRLIPPRSDER